LQSRFRPLHGRGFVFEDKIFGARAAAVISAIEKGIIEAASMGIAAIR